MLYFRNELKDRYNSTYQIKKALINREIYKIQNGIYSDNEFVNPLEIITKKYSNAIFTSESAFFYHDLTDVIPDKFNLATQRTAVRIRDSSIKQLFIPN